MLRMPEFQVHLPTTAAEAVSMREAHAPSRYVAGGTDLLPNLKHGLQLTSHLVSLTNVTELVGITADGGLRIGAATSLHAVATSDLVRHQVPALATAAASVAGPQHRRMGTLGGNVMLDTRCLYYNQSVSWREALGHCLKADGDWCHVIGSKSTCVAAHSADTVPVLMTLGATLEFLGSHGPVEVELAKFYKQNGIDNHAVEPNALLTAIVIPAQAQGHRSVYRKVRTRAAIDFPQLGLALSATFDGDTCTALTGVVSAIMPKPKRLSKLDAAVGTTLTDEVIDAIGQATYKQVRPQTSLHGDPAWRRHMARVEMKRALRMLRDDVATRATQ